jgi:hypothetical protein
MSEEIDALQRRVALLEDKAEIIELKNRYARFCDDGWDADGIASLFVADAHWRALTDVGVVVGDHHGPAAIRAHFLTRPALIPWTLHYMVNPVVDVAPDGLTAQGTWLMHSYSTVTDGEDPETAILLICDYKDRFVKVDGRWMFQELSCRVIHRTPLTEGWVRRRWL